MDAESFGVGIVIAFMIVGFIGAFIPMLPGTLLVWLAVLVHTIMTGFIIIGPGLLVIITLIAIVTGTANLWMSVLGARTGGATSNSIVWGVGGAVIGFLLLNLPGAVLGYVLGVLYGEYQVHKDWNTALKAGVGGLVGWGISTIVEASGALAIIVIFIWRVLI